MRKDLTDVLVCPTCKSELTLTVDDEDGEEAIEGSLHCAKCNEAYPIEDGLPKLLPPDLRTAGAAKASRRVQQRT